MGSETITQATGEGVRWDHPAHASIRILDPDQALIEVSPRRKKVAIVGFATSTRDLAPFDDSEWEIWALNQLYRHIPRADRWFEIHTNWNEYVVEGTDHQGWLASAPIPIYMTCRIPEVPHSVTYPLQRVIDDLQADYFTSTISYMIALAIHEGFGELALFGIDLIVGTEYETQKACAEFWLGVASGRGILVRLPPNSALLKTAFRYGYELEPDWGPIKLSMLQTRRQGLGEERRKLLERLYTIDGALQECEHWLELATLRLRGADVKPSVPQVA